MAKHKKSILVYVDWINIFEELSDDEAGKLIKHLFRYVNDRNPEAPDRLTKLLFEPIKQTLKRDLVNYETTCSKNRDNALIRWNKINAVACEGILNDAKHADSDIDKDKDKEKKNKKFTPPLLVEVENYFEENGYKKEVGSKAYNYYNTANWKDSKGSQVKNWKQKMISVWFKDENKINGNKIIPAFYSGPKR